MFICHLCIFSGEVSVKIFAHFVMGLFSCLILRVLCIQWPPLSTVSLSADSVTCIQLQSEMLNGKFQKLCTILSSGMKPRAAPLCPS